MKEKLMLENLKEKKWLTAINLFWFLVILFLTYRMPYFSDDFSHMNSLVDYKPLETIDRVLPSVFVYYKTWGGANLIVCFDANNVFAP